MNQTAQKIFVGLLAFIPIVLLPMVVFAQITSPITQPSLAALLISVIRVIIMIAVPIVVVAIVYSGFLFVTAGGNEQKITQAKQIIFWSLVGAFVLFGAEMIAEIVCNTVETISSRNICQ